MADIKQIQFKRNSIAGKVPTAAQLAEGELAINLADKALYTKAGTTVVQLTGQGMPETNTKKIVVPPTTADLGDIVIEDGLIQFNSTRVGDGADSSTVMQIKGRTGGGNDGWYIGGGGTSDKGYLELGTTDNGDEEIRFVQRAAASAIRRTLKLLDSTGHTRVPGNVYIDDSLGGSGSAFISKNKAFFGAGGTDIYMRNTAGGDGNQLTILNSGTEKNSLQFRGKDVFWKDNPPVKSEVGLARVLDLPQARQEDIPVRTGSTGTYFKIVEVDNPGDSSCSFSFAIAGGSGYGNPRQQVDFVSGSARSFTSNTALTSSNVSTFLQVRRLGDPKDASQYEYGLVKTSTGFDVWVKSPAYVTGVKLTVLGTDGETVSPTPRIRILLPTGYVTQTTEPEGFVVSPAQPIYDGYNKPDINSSTQGVLSIANGGTGGTSAAAARSNLGLGTAAVRDVGVGTNQLMEVGAYGLGGKGASLSITTNSRDLLKKLREGGSQFFRNTDSLSNTVFGMGPGIFTQSSDVQAAITVDWATANVRIIAANNANIDDTSKSIATNTLYGTANKPTYTDLGFISSTATVDQSVKGSFAVATTLSARQTHATGSNSANFTPSNQGAWTTWNRASGQGIVSFMNHTGDAAEGSDRGFEWITGSSGGSKVFPFTKIASLNKDGEFKANGALYAGNAKYGTDGNITGGGMFGGNLNTYLDGIKSNIDTSDQASVKKSGAQEMAGPLTIKNTGNADTNLFTIDTNASHTPILLSRSTTSNLSIGFKLSGMANMMRFGIDTNKDLRWGEAANLTENDLIITTKNYDSDYSIKTSNYKSVYVQSNLAGTPPKGSPGAANANGWKDGIRLYDTATGSTESYPTQYGTILSARAGEYRHFQFFSSSDTGALQTGLYYRSMRGGSENAGNEWQQVALASQQNRFTKLQVFQVGANFDGGIRANGNIGIGANAKSGDPNITFASGAMLREGTGTSGLGALVISAAATGANYIALRPKGDSDTANEVKITSDGSIELSSSNTDAYLQVNNVRYRAGTTDKNSAYIEANTGNIYLRTRRGSDTNGFTIESSTGSIIQNAAQGSANGALTRRDFVNTQVGTRLPLAGGTMTGSITMSGTTQISNATLPTTGSHLANKTYVDQEMTKATNNAASNASSLYLPLAGGTLTGTLTTKNIIIGGTLVGNSHGEFSGNLKVGGTFESVSDATFRKTVTLTGGDLNQTSGNLNSSGVGTFTGAVSVKAPASDDGTTHLWFYNASGKERAVLYSPRDNRRSVALRCGAGSDDSPTSEWTFDGSNGELIGPGASYRLQKNGNIVGDIYGGNITDWVVNMYNQCAQWVRTGTHQDIGQIGRPSPGKTVDAGWVMVGLNANSNEANQNLQIIQGRIQVWKNGQEWIDSAA